MAIICGCHAPTLIPTGMLFLAVERPFSLHFHWSYAVLFQPLESGQDNTPIVGLSPRYFPSSWGISMALLRQK